MDEGGEPRIQTRVVLMGYRASSRPYHHGATRETLRELYWMLIANGAGQWVAGHFVAVSALGYGFPLLFLLQNLNTLPWNRICVLLIEYFERNKAGPVQLELRGPADPNDPLNAAWELAQRVNRSE